MVTAALIVRSVRPRNADCGPPTDFNLCALERGYSIETARHYGSSVVLRLELNNQSTENEPVCSDGGDLRLTGRPLHTRSVKRDVRSLRSVTGAPARDVDVDVDVDVDGDGDGDGDDQRQSFVSMATIRASNSIAVACSASVMTESNRMASTIAAHSIAEPRAIA